MEHSLPESIISCLPTAIQGSEVGGSIGGAIGSLLPGAGTISGSVLGSGIGATTAESICVYNETHSQKQQ